MRKRFKPVELIDAVIALDQVRKPLPRSRGRWCMIAEVQEQRL